MRLGQDSLESACHPDFARKNTFSVSFVLEFTHVTIQHSNKQDEAAQESAPKYILDFNLWNILDW